MRWMTWAAAVVMSLPAAGALAAVVTVQDVKSASAQISADGRAIIVGARVDLSNGCLSNPRVQAPDPSARPDPAGVMTLSVVVDSSAGPGIACPMFFRANVAATPLRWTTFPRQGLKALRVVGARTPALAEISPQP